MKRGVFVTVYILTTLLYSLESVAQNNVIDEIVWVVGDEAIYKSEVEEARQEAQMRGSQWDGDPYCLIPEQLAVNKLFLNQAELDSITATNDDVSQQVDYYYKEMVNQAGTEEKLEEYYGMNSDQIKNRLYESRRQEYIISQVRDKIISRVKVTPAEVRRYIRDIPADEIPAIPTQVEVQIITIDPIIPQEEIDAVKTELRDYIDRVQSGEVSFSTLARLYSEDPGTARNGGDCGFFGRGEMVPEFSAVAFNMTDPNKISKIVETEYGFHILQFVERLGDRVRVRHILRKPRVPAQSVNDCLARLDTIAQNIRNGKNTFESSVVTYSQDKDTRNNNGLMANATQSGRTSRFRLQDLPSEIARAVDTLQVGNISRPFQMINERGKTTCVIAKLKSRTEGHKATITEDFQVMKDVVMEKRRQEKLHEWVVNKIKSTYVRVNDRYRDCQFEYQGWIK